MEQHKGKIIEAAIKNSGFRMKALANKLGIARNTLYIRLQEPDVKESFIIDIGKIIHYDFSNDFPGIYERNQDQDQDQDQYNIQFSNYRSKGNGAKLIDESKMIKDLNFGKLEALSKKYFRLMEDYNKLLKVLIILANNNELTRIKQEIMDFIQNDAQEG